MTKREMYIEQIKAIEKAKRARSPKGFSFYDDRAKSLIECWTQFMTDKGYDSDQIKRALKDKFQLARDLQTYWGKRGKDKPI